MVRITKDGLHKYEGYETSNGFVVKFFEKMGNHWTLLNTETWASKDDYNYFVDPELRF